MSLLTVIVRELRSQARQPLTHWLRILGGVSVVGAMAMTVWTVGRLGEGPVAPGAFANSALVFGTTLFGKMNFSMFAAIWLLVPLATADAVSRERREGTLALLYLTELGSVGIVVGKVFVHFLRAVGLFLAMAPWLLLPLVFGGVDLNDLTMALLLDFASVLLALGAGLLASTIPRDWLKSVLFAEVFAAILLWAMLLAHGGVLTRAVRVSIPATLTPGTSAFWNSRYSAYWEFYAPGAGIIERTKRRIELTTNASVAESAYWYGRFGPAAVKTDWQRLWGILSSTGQAVWFGGAIGIVAAAALILLGATLAGARRVDRSWQDVPPRAFMADLRRRFFLPRFRVDWLKRSLSCSLSANPIGWLHHYSPSGRMVKWGWCLGIMVAEIVFSQDPADAYAVQAWLGLFLLLGLTFSATGSFREEMETGAFELLLVTPLREHQIVVGRLRGLWRQFLPAMILYAAGNIYLASGWNDLEHAPQAWLSLVRTITAFGCLPLIGLYFSVRRLNFFVSWLATCALGLLPATVGRAFGANEFSMALLQLSVALAAGYGLVRRLRHRAILPKPARG